MLALDGHGEHLLTAVWARFRVAHSSPFAAQAIPRPRCFLLQRRKMQRAKRINDERGRADLISANSSAINFEHEPSESLLPFGRHI